ncbi:MAG TPA: HD domain-containing protein [archaeon]|nr:HD domain-containing protein [archaeon]
MAAESILIAMQQKIVSIESVIASSQKFSKKSDRELLRKAFDFALKKHNEAKESARMQHLLCTALEVSEMGVDDATIASALLHDAVLKKCAQAEEIREKFGVEIAKIAEECSKGFEIEQKNRNMLSEGLLSTVILGSIRDVRAIFITLASAIDTLGRQGIVSENEKKDFAKMCFTVWVPVCEKLGLHGMKWRLEDLSFKALNPKEYNEIKSIVNEKIESRESEVNLAREEIESLLKKESINARVFARPKHFFAIRKKIKSGKKFSEIYDLRGVRIICENIRQCYEILGIINSNYSIIPQEFDDYIINPKGNNYRSLHTVIIWKDRPVEVQIRTWEMHWDNETGLASHWAYKDYSPDAYFDKKLSWALQIVEWLQAKEGTKKFLEALRMDFGENEIFVLTPKKQAIVLPENSTPIDFAFAIHSDLGLKCGKAKVNGKIVPLNYALENGDLVEIIPMQSVQAKRDWLSIVKSDKAKLKIRQKLGIKTAPKKEKKQKAAITTKSSSVRIAKCCSPLPGEGIIGLRTTKRKIIAHRADCRNIQKCAKARLVALDWDIGSGKNFEVQLRIKARESSSLLPGLLNAVSSAGATIVSTSAKANKGKVVEALFNVRIQQAKQLEKIIQKIKKLPQVFEVERA